MPFNISSDPPRIRRSLLVFWTLVCIAIPIWAHFDGFAWDVIVYRDAINSLRAGHDPYADAIEIQKAVHAKGGPKPGEAPPYSYVYSPITLPILRAVGSLPDGFVAISYWSIYAIAVLIQIWATFRATLPPERRYFLFIAPLVPFFPGFLANGTVLGGNIAYILYAAALLAAVYGWRHQRWIWFYFAVLAASCVKAPLLSLIVIPVLSARRQWIPAALTAVAGIGLFAAQPLLWPTLFKHYLEAIELQFSYNRDFGCSPAGLFSDYLVTHGHTYAPGTYIFFLAYALPVLGALFYLSRKYLQGRFSLHQWIPVLLTGTILLNPRLIEYDVAPLVLPLVLIAWRFLRTFATIGQTVLYLAVFSAIANGFGLTSWQLRKQIDGPLLIVFFILGSWTLIRHGQPIPDETI